MWVLSYHGEIKATTWSNFLPVTLILLSYFGKINENWRLWKYIRWWIFLEYDTRTWAGTMRSIVSSSVYSRSIQLPNTHNICYATFWWMITRNTNSQLFLFSINYCHNIWWQSHPLRVIYLDTSMNPCNTNNTKYSRNSHKNILP